MGLIDRWLKLLRDPAQTALPSPVLEDQRGMLRVLTGNGSSTNDELYFGRNAAGTLEFHKVTGKVDDTGDSITGAYTITNASTSAALTVDQNGTTSASTSTGGAILLENTGNTGAGLVIYSNAGGTATGRLLNVRADNAAFPQPAVHVDYDGTANAVEIAHASTDSSAQALNVVSTNPNDTCVGIQGAELTKGTVKIVHTGQADGSDSSASAISIDLQTAGTAAQGIYVDATSGTTGSLLVMRNSTVNKLVVDKDGKVTSSSGVSVTPSSPTFLPLRIAAHASQSTNLAEVYDTAGTLRARITNSGEVIATTMRATNFGNASSNNNSVVQPISTGTLITRNIADSGVALTVNQINASSTGDLLALQFGGTEKFAVTKDGHISTSGTTPSIAATANAGTTASVSITGNDTCGLISLTPGGAGIGGGNQLTVTFAAARPDTNYVVMLQAMNDGAAGVSSPLVRPASLGTTSWSLNRASVALVSGTVYSWLYWVVEY